MPNRRKEEGYDDDDKRKLIQAIPSWSLSLRLMIGIEQTPPLKIISWVGTSAALSTSSRYSSHDL